MQLLTKINTPADLRKLSLPELTHLCAELREFMQQQTTTKEGHINSSLGVTELTVALHHLFNTPQDVLIWDVGHQAYIHKILTGRKGKFKNNRQKDGLAGFTSSHESEYDPFGAGHSSTSISAAVGFAMANRLRKSHQKAVAVIGDGALTGGMSFEALNYLGQQQLDVLVVLNDNQSSIDKNIGALAEYGDYENYCKALNIKYLGECDGNDLETLLPALREARDQSGARLLRVNTLKGKGRKPDLVVAKPSLGFQEVFTESLIALARADERIVALSPAMLSGSGLSAFQKEFPDRCFDVGIAEQHAVTMAAGLATAGFRPVVHLYSTFAQRAYDQIIHDVALQNLPVIFVLDRAGLVGQDGATHHGAFDPGFLSTIPNLTIGAPLDGASLRGLLQEALAQGGPWAIRYPKDSFKEIHTSPELPCGKSLLLKAGSEKAVLSFGAIGAEVAKAVAGTSFAHYDFPYLKPLDEEELEKIGQTFTEIITVEENSARGGLGDSVRAFFAIKNLSIRVRSIALPDRFVPHATRQEQLQMCGLDAESIRAFLGAP